MYTVDISKSERRRPMRMNERWPSFIARLAPDHVAQWHADVLEEDLHVALGAVVISEGLHGPHEGDAGRVHGHQDL